MNSLDLSLLHQINVEWSNPAFDWLMPAVSALEAWLPLIIVIALIALWRGGRRARVMLLCLGVAIGFGDAVVSHTLKKIVGRVRPRDAVAGVYVRSLGKAKPEFMRLFKNAESKPAKPNISSTHGNSFPSSHTVNMFAVATVMAWFYLRSGLFMFLIAGLVAYSRIYCGAHWPSDMLPSMGLGILTGLVVLAVARRIPVLRMGEFGLGGLTRGESPRELPTAQAR
jgi:undecaprenyl-diphosphatase